MRRIRSKDTKAELTVRRLLHAAGYRYRIHAKSLPGTPDIAFKSRCKVIFIHGCFWHQHDAVDCNLSKRPRENVGYWLPKLARNVERDGENIEQLRREGWEVLVIWECELRDRAAVLTKLVEFVGPPRHP